MTKPELHVFFQWQCGCGAPDESMRLVRDVLATFQTKADATHGLSLFAEVDRPTFEKAWDEHSAQLKSLLPTEGLYYFVLYMLTEWDLLEHGGSVSGSWLTDKGREMLAALDAESVDYFESFMNADVCIHGFDCADDSHDCASMP